MLREATCALAIALAASTASGAWMSANGFFARPPTIDAAVYRNEAAAFRRTFDARGLGALFSEAWETPSRHPPLMTLAAVPFVDPDLGATPRGLWFAVQPFAVVLFLGTWLLARRFGGFGFAAAAASLAAALPVVAVNLRPFFPQLPMAAFLVLGHAAWLRSEGFARRGASVGCGLAFGLATLCKVLAPAYAAVPALHALATTCAGRDGRSRRNAALALGVAAAVALPWYVKHGAAALDLVRGVVGPDGQKAWSAGTSFTDPARYLYYLRQWIDVGVGLPLVVLATVLGAVAALGRLRRAQATEPAAPSRPDGRALAAAAGVTVLVLSLGQIAGGAFYLLPLAPAFAIAVVAGVARLRGAARRVAVVVLVAAAAVDVAAALRPFDADDAVTLRRFVPALPFDAALVPACDRLLTLPARLSGAVPRREAEPWPIEAIVEAIRVGRRRDRPRILQSAIHAFVHAETLRHEALRRGFAWDWLEPATVFGASPEAAAATLRDLDYVVVHEVRDVAGYPNLAQCDAYARTFGRRLEEAARYAPTPQVTFVLAAVRPL